MLTQEFDPGGLGAGVMLRGLGEIHEASDRLVEAAGKLRIGDLALRIERLVRLRQRKHVGIDARTQMLEGYAQRPQAAIAAGHRG